MSRTKLNIGNIIFLILSLMIVSYHCSVRKHDNIFDPKSGIDTLNMKLELRRADSIIVLSWSPHFQVHIEGFHLYRKAGNETRFSSLAILSANQTEYHDSLVHYDTPYAYYLTLIGKSNESPPTRILKTVPGPGQIWILDRWNEYILKFSYDMRHTLLSHYAIWVPQALAFNSAKNRSIITYPLYHYVEVIDPFYGVLQGEITAIRYPYACAYNPQNQAFWISDSSGALYRYDGHNTLQLLDNQLIRPLEIAFDAQGKAVVLDSRAHALIFYNADGTRRGTISTVNGRRFASLKFLSANPLQNYFFVIEETDTTDILYRISTLTDSIRCIFRQQGLAVARENPTDHTLWVAINDQEQAKILQLSAAGLRLNTLKGFEFISDFVINPVNGNLVVADPRAHRVLNLRPDGSLVGSFDKAPYPFKVYIE